METRFSPDLVPAEAFQNFVCAGNESRKQSQLKGSNESPCTCIEDCGGCVCKDVYDLPDDRCSPRKSRTEISVVGVCPAAFAAGFFFLKSNLLVSGL